MKNLVMIFGLSLTFSFNSYAYTPVEVVKIDSAMIEALITNDGDYARIEDLSEGFVKFDGVEINGDLLKLDTKNPLFNVDSVLLKNGLENKISRVIGGDMGGGGTKRVFRGENLFSIDEKLLEAGGDGSGGGRVIPGGGGTGGGGLYR